MIKPIRTILITALILVIGSIYAFVPLGDERSYPRGTLADYYGNDYGFFRIDPETILASLNGGTMDVFLPEERDIEDEVWGRPALFALPIPWRQSDYLMIANALNQFAFNDTLDKWELYLIDFHANCSDGSNGFRSSTFTYFKTSFGNIGRIKYVTRLLYITPEYMSVTWGGGASFLRPFHGWKNIDLNKVEISAEDAVKIAEENGGQEARLRIQNRCEISASLLPRNWDGWKVRFGYDFEMYIDPYTGEIIR
ncbi:MAG: hypothetical protein HFACDABA_00734 [Anaerolineales bacterium]|nr:hypothetical protein [Anaerolineales bacterium]